MTRLACIAIVAIALGAACDVFDKSLYEMREADGGSDPDAGGDAAVPLLADTCIGEVPMRESSSATFEVDTMALSDDIRAVGACTGQSAPGNEGFFGVEMGAGDKWHFHVRTLTGGRNPAIYVLGSACDARTCDVGDAIDRCDTDSDEHLSFVAPSGGTFRVGVDDRNAGGGLYRVLVIRPTCGNGGMAEHSESCDDGNTEDGDGCDSLCRHELSNADTDEQEPNDDPTAANVVLTGAGASLRVTMLNRSAAACADGTPPIEMVLWQPGGRTAVGDGSVRAGNGCPVIDDAHAFAQDLPAGEHIVSVTTDENEGVLDYRLLFELVTT